MLSLSDKFCDICDRLPEKQKKSPLADESAGGVSIFVDLYHGTVRHRLRENAHRRTRTG